MSAFAESLVEKTLEEFHTVTKKPEEFLNVQTKLSNKLKKSTKQLYDLNSLCQENGDKPPQALPELITDNFDEEQIWQELELYNDPHIIQLLTNVSQLVASKNSIQFKTKKKKTKKLEIVGNDIVDSELESEVNLEENLEDSELENEISKYKSQLDRGDQSDSEGENDIDFDAVEADESDENILEQDKKVNEPSKPKSAQKSKPSIVDDNFFKLSQLETFLTEQENRDEKQRKRELGEDVKDDDEDDIDLFQDITDDEGEDARNAMYSEFFDDADVPESGEKNVRFKDQDKSQLITGDVEEDEVQEEEEAEAEEDVEEEDEVEEDDEDVEEDNEEEEEVEGDNVEEDDEENDFNELMKTKDQNRLLREDESEGEDINEVLGGGAKKEDTKSSYELRQEKLKKQITKLEVSNLASKPWQMSGEVGSTLRPENSLLEEHLQFDHTTKMIPVITEETSKNIEEIITQRIKDKAWDDVERKVKPTENTMEYKKRIVLDQEKSKQSLAQVYEDEYIKQQKKDKEEDEEERNPEREVIKEMMQSLFIKLDALSNFHYTPKHIQAELRVISNLPSITMEEVAPVSKSDAQLVAPEEIKAKVKGELKGTTEKSETDRKRERRKKKTEKRTKIREKARHEKLVNKMNPGLGNKYSKESALKDLEKSSKINKNDVTVVKSDKKKSSLTSSTTFFKQLQEEVQSQVLSRKAEKQKRKNQVVANNSAKKLKL